MITNGLDSRFKQLDYLIIKGICFEIDAKSYVMAMVGCDCITNQMMYVVLAMILVDNKAHLTTCKIAIYKKNKKKKPLWKSVTRQLCRENLTTNQHQQYGVIDIYQNPLFINVIRQRYRSNLPKTNKLMLVFLLAKILFLSF